MSLTLNWIDRNITVDKFRIYRANSVILDGALPAMLAEVPAGTFTYTDATAVRNQMYHYRVSAVVGTEETLSSDMALAYMPYTGPGPQKLLRGDWGLGTFGRMNPEDLFNANELVNIVNNPLITDNAAGAKLTCWVKMVYNGKILFIPDNAIANTYGSGCAWSDLYKAGLVYGTDDSSTWSAAAKSTYGVIPQNYVVAKGADSFVVRLPGTRVGALSAGAVPANQVGGEFDYVMAPNFQSRIQNFNVLALDDLVAYSANMSVYTKDVTTTAGDTTILRGANNTPNVPDGVILNILGNYNSIYNYWRPVLELVL
jgi:hypothetical protein